MDSATRPPMDDGTGSNDRKRRRDDVGARCWSDIPLDILCIVFRRLTILDFVRSGAVSASWRSAMLQCRPMLLEPPWVIPFSGHGVVCPPERRLRWLPTLRCREMIQRSEYIGSSNGWLGLQHMESVHILHALSGAVVRLPDLTHILGVNVVPYHDGTGWWRGLTHNWRLPANAADWNIGERRYALKPKGPLGSSFFESIVVVQPSAGADGDCDQLTVLALCRRALRILFVRPGDRTWSFVKMLAPMEKFICSLSSRQGSVYAVDINGCVAAWDYGRSLNSDPTGATFTLVPKFTKILISSRPSRPMGRLVQTYLVEEGYGDLLQVEREVEYDSGTDSYKTLAARIFRLGQAGGPWPGGEGRVWKLRLEHLGNGGRAIMVGRGFSAAFACSDFPWLHRNCVYFTDGIYDMMTQKMRRFPRRELDWLVPLAGNTWFRGNWLVPALPSPAAGSP